MGTDKRWAYLQDPYVGYGYVTPDGGHGNLALLDNRARAQDHTWRADNLSSIIVQPQTTQNTHAVQRGRPQYNRLAQRLITTYSTVTHLQRHTIKLTARTKDIMAYL